MVKKPKLFFVYGNNYKYCLYYLFSKYRQHSLFQYDIRSASIQQLGYKIRENREL